jgi:hypothetical protein
MLKLKKEKEKEKKLNPKIKYFVKKLNTIMIKGAFNMYPS